MLFPSSPVAFFPSTDNPAIMTGTAVCNIHETFVDGTSQHTFFVKGDDGQGYRVNADDFTPDTYFSIFNDGDDRFVRYTN